MGRYPRRPHARIDFGPAILAGGSAGSRVSLLTAARHPELVSALYLWWISGGTYGLMSLGNHYVADNLYAAVRFGMKGVAKLRTWREAIEVNPGNRERILAMNRDDFVATMRSWIDHYIPNTESPVPGMSPADFAGLSMPVTILRSGTTDLHHPRETSQWVHRLIPHSELTDPPWGDDEWNKRGDASMSTGTSLFEGWPALAPEIAEFVSINHHERAQS
jgi:pimeloyl-ACP methyl ester carboxylesterase